MYQYAYIRHIRSGDVYAARFDGDSHQPMGVVGPLTYTD